MEASEKTLVIQRLSVFPQTPSSPLSAIVRIFLTRIPCLCQLMSAFFKSPLPPLVADLIQCRQLFFVFFIHTLLSRQYILFFFNKIGLRQKNYNLSNFSFLVLIILLQEIQSRQFSRAASITCHSCSPWSSPTAELRQ